MLITLGNRCDPLTEQNIKDIASTGSSIYRTAYIPGDVLNFILVQTGNSIHTETVLDSEVEMFLNEYTLCPITKNRYIKG